MPSRSAHPCAFPGCGQLARGASRCDEHRRAVDRARGTSAERGYGDAAWKRLRAAHLAAHPSCSDCAAIGLDVPARHVDHVRAHRGNEALRLDPANLDSKCASCHSRKTVLSDYGFGRPPAR